MLGLSCFSVNQIRLSLVKYPFNDLADHSSLSKMTDANTCLSSSTGFFFGSGVLKSYLIRMDGKNNQTFVIRF
jgi:hypothetical protein